jgi:hypothetical protein
VLREGNYLPLPPQSAKDERNRLQLDTDQTPFGKQAQRGMAK